MDPLERSDDNASGLSNRRLGVDIGGSGIKCALVDIDGGALVGERIKVDTPQPATPWAISDAVAEIVSRVDYEGPIGVGFPAVIVDGEARTANNIDDSNIGVNVRDLIIEKTAHQVTMVNDADAAALCEARYGVAQDVPGLVIVLTFGSGIGSGFLVDGRLVPNVELGILEFEGHVPAESHFSAKARKTQGLSWDEWGERTNRYITHVNAVFSPQMIVLSGGVSKKWDRWAGQLSDSLPVVRAERANNAGIIGAATLVAG